MVSFVRVFVTVFALSAFIALMAGPADAQNVTSALTQANKLLEQGQPAEAIDLIEKTLKTGDVPSDLAAKAMLMRAQAQEKLGKHAFALADYNSALWMQDLSSRDRALAEAGRQRIMAKLGVGSAPAETAAAPQQEEIRATPTEKRTGGIGSFFSGVFDASGDDEKNAPPPQAQQASINPAPNPQPAVQRAPPPAPAPVQVSNVYSANESQSQESEQAAQRQLTGGFAIQFSAVRSEDNAIYEADRVGKRYSEWLNGRTPSIMVRGMKDGGTLYKIIAAPYEHGEGLATCELLKTKGVDCMLISR